MCWSLSAVVFTRDIK